MDCIAEQQLTAHLRWQMVRRAETVVAVRIHHPASADEDHLVAVLLQCRLDTGERLAQLVSTDIDVHMSALKHLGLGAGRRRPDLHANTEQMVLHLGSPPG
ncbi:hypothetical protein D3C85_1515360 [compost metagenome]